MLDSGDVMALGGEPTELFGMATCRTGQLRFQKSCYVGVHILSFVGVKLSFVDV